MATPVINDMSAMFFRVKREGQTMSEFYVDAINDEFIF